MAHYYTKDQKLEDVKKIMITIKGISFELFTGKGVFSKEHIDIGSKILVENAVIEKEWKILDLGCGIGVVGISLKKLNPQISLVMSDVNKAAVRLAGMNAKLHGIEAKSIESSVFESIDEKFNSILLNPPQTAGKSLCFRMIEESKIHLESEGLFQLVARHSKGGAEFEKKMFSVFGNCTQAAKESGFRVYVSKL